jgi:hypothetical protein
MSIQRKVTTVVAVIACAALVVVGLELTDTTHLFHEAKVRNGINYGPPTDTEKQDSDSHKDNIPPNNTGDTNSDNTTGAKKSVTPEITTFRQGSTDFTVNGFVNGVVESDGTCTLTMTLASDATQKVTSSRTGEANSSNTTCGEISIPLSKLHAGTWNTTLTYNSATAAGVSDVNPLEVK